MYKWVGELKLSDHTRLRSVVHYKDYRVIPQIIVISPAFLGYERVRLAFSLANWEKLKEILEWGLWRIRKKRYVNSSKSLKIYYQYGWDYYNFLEKWFEVLKHLDFLDDVTTLDNLVDGTVISSPLGPHYIRVSTGMELVTAQHTIEIIEQACQHSWYYSGLWITDGRLGVGARKVADEYNFRIIDKDDTEDYFDIIKCQQLWGEINISSRTKLVVRSIENCSGVYKDMVDIRKYTRTRKLHGWTTQGITVTYEEIGSLINLIQQMLLTANDRSNISIVATKILKEGILEEILKEFGL
jgi:hypothetical protein